MTASPPTPMPDWAPAWAWRPGPVASADLPLGELFAYGCAAFPDKTALADRRERFDFRSLERLARRMAARLRDGHGVRPGDRVMVVARKSCLVPPLAVALWKLGAVYMPVDAEAPADRLAGIAAQARPARIVAVGRAPDLGTPVLDAATLAAGVEEGPAIASHAHGSDEIAYIIHTSGSTGAPKGVEITVGALKHYFAAHNKILRYHPWARVFSLTPFHFDVSIEDTLLPLSLGAHVYQFNRPMTGRIMRETLSAEKVTHLIAVSTLLTMISEDPSLITREAFPAMEMVMTGAELCAPTVINLWKERLPEARVINAYGPTEVTIVCTCHEIAAAEPGRTAAYPIGKPLDGTVAILLDAEGREIDRPGTPGELCLGGPQVMAGYAGRPDETARRIFVRDGVRFYRSGDICLRDEAGDYHFVGRNDGEVKIAGRRIHLGEIQNQCLAVDGVERAAVGVIERGSARLIAAVLVAGTPGVLDAVRARLERTLPAYMRPAVWGLAGSTVLSGSGKTDDKVLLGRLDERFEIGSDAVVGL